MPASKESTMIPSGITIKKRNYKKGETLCIPY